MTEVIDAYQLALPELAARISYGMDLKPAKVAVLRKKLTSIFAELERLEAKG